MQIERLKSLVVVMAVLLFLLAVSVASAADREERLFSKQPGKSPAHMLHVGKRQGQRGSDLQHFLKSLGALECEADCCWAYADCGDYGGAVYCDSAGCGASCDDGSSAVVVCEET